MGAPAPPGDETASATCHHFCLFPVGAGRQLWGAPPTSGEADAAKQGPKCPGAWAGASRAPGLTLTALPKFKPAAAAHSPGPADGPLSPAGQRPPLPLASLGAPPAQPHPGPPCCSVPRVGPQGAPTRCCGECASGAQLPEVSKSAPDGNSGGGGGGGQAVSAVMTPLQPWTCTCLEVQPAPRPTPSPCTAPHRARVLPQRPLALPGGGEPGWEGHSSIRPSHGTPA